MIKKKAVTSFKDQDHKIVVSKLHQGKSSQKVCDTSEHFHPHSIDESVNFF